jgi:HD superfamily phosphohydrolase/tRNA A-37 threonylcarbamoyl transferase component Bud32
LSGRAKRRYPIVFRVGDTLPDNSDYLLLQPDPSEHKEVIKPLGDGGAGVVYKATYKTAMERAIKFLSPADRLRNVDSQLFEETFLREIGVLVDVTHTHIAKITDFGSTNIDENRIQYYAMDYIEGEPLAKAWTKEGFTGRAFLDVIDQLLAALEYLHDRRIMHCDVKSDNILVHKFGPRPYSATLVDLGVAKVLGAVPSEDGTQMVEIFDQPEESDPDPEDDRTFFFSTPRIVREKWKHRLRRDISRTDLLEMFPSHELYSLGVLLDDALSNSDLKGKLRSELRDPGLEALESLRDRLRTEEPRDDYYDSVAALRQDWEKLDSGYLSPLKIPEMALAANAKTSVALPTGRVSLTDRLFDIINHPLFQRLHEIPQLELSHLLFPGAKHSRFMHSLTVFDLTRQYLTHLLGDPNFRLMVEPVDIEGLLLRALLHDIGHYPLSHMFEDFADEQRQGEGTLTVPTDDDLFWQFVAEGDDGFAPDFAIYSNIIDSALKQLTDGKVMPLRRYLHDGKHFSDGGVEAMARLVHPTTASHAVLAGILSSPVDADKVSYLMDDSLMTGARYGLGIDLDALLGALRAPQEEDLTSASHLQTDLTGRPARDGRPGRGLRPTIALKDKGLTAAESVVLARYWMLKRVYWHHTSRSIMAMVKFVIASLLEHPTIFNMERYIEQTVFGTLAEGLRLLSDAFDKIPDTESVSRPCRNPLHGLLGGNRDTYKRLLTISSGGEGPIYSALAFKRQGGLHNLSEALLSALEAELPEVGPLCTGDLIVDIPVRKREELGGRALVYLRKEPAKGRPLTEDKSLSPVLGSLKDEFDLHVKKCRIFVHPEIHAKLEPRMSTAVGAVSSALEDHCRQG